VEACSGGHAAAVQLLVRAGAPLQTVRLSQTKGPAVRTMVMEACRATAGGDGDGDDEAPEPVGYARVQQRSNAFYGPRRTPISGKLKKRLLREKRERKRVDGNADATSPSLEASTIDSHDDAGNAAQPQPQPQPEPEPEPERELDSEDPAPGHVSYAATVHDVKKTSKLSRGARRARARASSDDAESAEESECPAAATVLPEAGSERQQQSGMPPMSRTALKKARRLQRKAVAAAAAPASADDSSS
jgi:hypothetical protein